MKVRESELAELQQSLNDFKIEREKLQNNMNLPYLFSDFPPVTKFITERFLQKADRIYLELYLIVESLKSEKNG